MLHWSIYTFIYWSSWIILDAFMHFWWCQVLNNYWKSKVSAYSIMRSTLIQQKSSSSPKMQVYPVTVQKYVHPVITFCFKLLPSALWRQAASCKQVCGGLPLCSLVTLRCLNSTKIQPRWQCRAQYSGSCLQIASMPLTPTSPGPVDNHLQIRAQLTLVQHPVTRRIIKCLNHIVRWLLYVSILWFIMTGFLLPSNDVASNWGEYICFQLTVTSKN